MRSTVASLPVLVCAGLLAIPAIARAEIELKNDGFVSGGAATFQGGFVIGEAAASRFVAPDTGRQLTKVQLLYGNTATTNTFTLEVFDDSAGTDDPGAELFRGDFELTGSDSAMHELDLRAANVFVTAQFRVAIVVQHAGLPSIANDTDTTVAADRNFILAAGAGWKKSSALGLTGDWVIRAFITEGTGPSGNISCDVDAECSPGDYCDAPHHACTFDCRTDGECGGGTCDGRGRCLAGSGGGDGGCRTDGGGGASGAVLGLGGLLAILGSRRRLRRA